MPIARILLTAVGAFFLTASFAQSSKPVKAGNIVITQAVARATVPGQPSAAAYLTIENAGKDPDKLIAIASPAAKSAELHTMSMDGNIMRMREAGTIDLAPAAKLAMKPGEGFHVMLMGLKKPLRAGDKVPLTLTFERAGKANLTAVVEGADAQKSGAAAGSGSPSGSGHQHHH